MIKFVRRALNFKCGRPTECREMLDKNAVLCVLYCSVLYSSKRAYVCTCPLVKLHLTLEIKKIKKLCMNIYEQSWQRLKLRTVSMMIHSNCSSCQGSQHEISSDNRALLVM